MARGNQRDKAREKNQKAAAATKSKNNLSGSEMQKAKLDAAQIMAKKQAEADARKKAAADAEIAAKKDAIAAKRAGGA